LTHSVDLKIAREKRDNLQYELNQIYMSAPRTFKQAYEVARKGLKLNEELTFSEEELDKLLPEKLR